MDVDKMARFIAELRKSKQMTQKELAEKLGVTDKAVSKWERGLSCPDIALLPLLSDIFGVTISELLNGERAEQSVPELEAVVETTLQYADTTAKRKSKNMRVIIGGIISATFFIGMFVCVICDLAISKRFTWSLFPISSIIFAWIVIMPSVIWKKRGVFLSCVALSVSIIPFLYVLEKIIGIDGLIMPIGIRASLLSIVYLWVIYILIVRLPIKLYISIPIVIVCGIPFSIAMNAAIMKFTGNQLIDVWDVMNIFIMVVVAVVIFVIGRVRQR